MPLVLFYLLLIIAQGFLSSLLAPLPAPDLFIIALLTLAWRLPPWQFVLVAYGIGLLQDVFGYGNLGVHALGLATAAMLVSSLRLVINQQRLVEQLLMIVLALLGKWCIFSLMLLWFGVAQPWHYIADTVPLELLLTVIFSSMLLPLANWLIDRQGVLRRELI